MRLTIVLDNILDYLDRGEKLADLKAYISTAHDQAEMFEKEQIELQEELAQYKDAYEKAATELERLKPAHLKDELEPVAVDVLKFVASATQTEVKAIDVAAGLTMGRTVAEMFLRELAARKCVQATLWDVDYTRYFTYSITPFGTRYLFDRGHVR
jgi:inosine-uridine nucleoside N-ribohydrolase